LRGRYEPWWRRLLPSANSGFAQDLSTTVGNRQQKAGGIMQTNVITRFFGRVFKLLLALIPLLAAQLLLFTALIQLMRHHKRFRVQVFTRFNAVTLPIAGRRFSPYGLLKHTGRRSYQSYVTPLKVYPFGDGFVLTLTYGPEVDWCRNILASGTCALTWKGREYALEKPELLPISQAWEAYPLPTRLVGRAGGVKQCLWVHRPSTASEKEGSEKDRAGVTS
jgi:deazaflavin-dependent oxidoreductase (nitroreductase family)